MISFSASELDEGKRFDEVLFLHGCSLSRAKCQALIKEGKARVNGRSEKASLRIKPGDILECEEYEAPKSSLEPENIPLDIVYEDESLLVINKQAGLIVHPGNGNESGTLVNALLYRQLSLAPSSDPLRPGIVHRIDKDTSGLLVVAKTEEALLFLQSQLSDHSMHREYIALAYGIINEEAGEINAPLARDKSHPTKMAVDNEGKSALTYFKVLKRYPFSKATLLDCRLKTGRTHQIRVHMDYIGHPLIGDPLYGRGNRKLYDKGQLLHAYRLSFVHPLSKKEMVFEAPLPKGFASFLKTLS
jgi:23S rRNA pseudouridine1911/1915/1917 synthase